MKEYVLIQRPSLPKEIAAVTARLEYLDDERIVQAYNVQCHLGFTGVYAQAIYVLGLHQQLFLRFGSSPLGIKHNCLLTMQGCVKWDNGDWVQCPYPSC